MKHNFIKHILMKRINANHVWDVVSGTWGLVLQKNTQMRKVFWILDPAIVLIPIL